MVYPNIMTCIIDPYSASNFASFSNIPYAKVDKYGIPLHWERFITLDHGLRNPTAVYFHAINAEKGEVVTYLEYYKANTLVPDHAKAIKPEVELIPAGKIRFMVADPSIRNKTDPVNGKSVQALYQEYGLYFSEGNNSIEAGILRVNSYIERGKWKIYRTCVNLIREAINYKFPELSMDTTDKNLDEKPVKAHDHAMDSIRYGFMRLPDDPSFLVTQSYTPDTNYNKSSSSKEYDEWHWSEEMAERYSESESDWMSYC